MTFNEMLNSEGFFYCEEFGNGFCFFISPSDNLQCLTFKSETDLHPIIDNANVYASSLDRTYKRVRFISDLFQKGSCNKPAQKIPIEKVVGAYYTEQSYGFEVKQRDRRILELAKQYKHLESGNDTNGFIYISQLEELLNDN